MDNSGFFAHEGVSGCPEDPALHTNTGHRGIDLTVFEILEVE